MRQCKQSCLKKGTSWQNCKENSMFFLPKKLQEKGVFFSKNCKRKCTVSDTTLAHPHTKIRQVPPPGNSPSTNPTPPDHHIHPFTTPFNSPPSSMVEVVHDSHIVSQYIECSYKVSPLLQITCWGTLLYMFRVSETGCLDNTWYNQNLYGRNRKDR